MISGSLGISSLGQFAPGSIGYTAATGILLPASFDRTFLVPQNNQIWAGNKSSEEIVNFSFNWLTETGTDLIEASAWTLESTDLSVVLTAIDPTSTIATILLSGGIANNIYNVTNIITTQSGLKLDATFRLSIDSYSY